MGDLQLSESPCNFSIIYEKFQNAGTVPMTALATLHQRELNMNSPSLAADCLHGIRGPGDVTIKLVNLKVSLVFEY